MIHWLFYSGYIVSWSFYSVKLLFACSVKHVQWWGEAVRLRIRHLSLITCFMMNSMRYA